MSHVVYKLLKETMVLFEGKIGEIIKFRPKLYKVIQGALMDEGWSNIPLRNYVAMGDKKKKNRIDEKV